MHDPIFMTVEKKMNSGRESALEVSFWGGSSRVIYVCTDPTTHDITVCPRVYLVRTRVQIEKSGEGEREGKDTLPAVFVCTTWPFPPFPPLSFPSKEEKRILR